MPNYLVEVLRDDKPVTEQWKADGISIDGTGNLLFHLFGTGLDQLLKIGVTKAIAKGYWTNVEVEDTNNGYGYGIK